MFSLQAHLSTMSFKEEVSEFSEGNGATVVDIDSEDIFHDIVNLVLRFFLEDVHHDFFNGLDVDFIIGVHILSENFTELTP